MANKIISGCRRVALQVLCTKACEKKKNQMKRSSALSTFPERYFAVFVLFASILFERINLKLLTTKACAALVPCLSI